MNNHHTSTIGACQEEIYQFLKEIEEKEVLTFPVSPDLGEHTAIESFSVSKKFCALLTEEKTLTIHKLGDKRFQKIQKISETAGKIHNVTISKKGSIMTVASDRCLDLYEMDNISTVFSIKKNLESGKFMFPQSLISDKEDQVVFAPDYSTIYLYKKIVSKDTDGFS